MLERSETLIKLTGVLKMSNEITNDMDVIELDFDGETYYIR